MSSQLLDRFGIVATELANVEERVGDEELINKAYFMVLCAFTRARPQEGSQITKPMETWKGFGEINNRWIVRTLASRAHLGRLLMSQAQYHGLGFWNVSLRIDEPGAVLPTPGAEGVYQLVSLKTGEPYALAGTIAIDGKKGKLAGTGRAFVYNASLVAKPLGHLLKKDPTLPMHEKAVLALSADDDEAPDGDAAVKTVEAKAVTVEADPEKNGKKKR